VGTRARQTGEEIGARVTDPQKSDSLAGARDALVAIQWKQSARRWPFWLQGRVVRTLLATSGEE
jgi:hypothetical protein